MSSEHRREGRHVVEVAGRYRIRNGNSRDVWIKDISEYGVRFFDKFSVLTIDTEILVKIGNIGPIPTEVRWREGNTVGGRFERPLHPSVLGHIIEQMDRLERGVR